MNKDEQTKTQPREYLREIHAALDAYDMGRFQQEMNYLRAFSKEGDHADYITNIYSWALQRASENGLEQAVDILLDEGADPTQNNSGCLRLSARDGYLNIVKKLVDHGANPLDSGSQSFQWAAQNGHLEVVKFLAPLSNPKSDESLALSLAAKCGETAMVAYLIPLSNPKDNDSDALLEAAKGSHFDCVSLLYPVSNPKAVWKDLRAGNHEEGIACLKSFEEFLKLQKKAGSSTSRKTKRSGL